MKRDDIARSIVLVYFTLLIFSCALVASARSETIFLPAVASASINEFRAEPASTPSAEQQVIDLVATIPAVKEWLDRNSGWQTNVYLTDDGENIWQVDFCKGIDCADWLGYGKVNLTTGKVIEHFVTRELTNEEFAVGKEKIEQYLSYDPEVQAYMGNPYPWAHEVDWNRWDQLWTANYTYGLDAFTVRLIINKETDKVEFDSIVNPNEMDEDAKEEERLNQARQLIWEAEGTGEAVEGHDRWKTYVEYQKDNLYTVAFVDGDTQIFSALVDVEKGTVLESGK